MEPIPPQPGPGSSRAPSPGAARCHDPLTGLLDRRALLEALREDVLRAGASEQALAVVFVDLNGFKRINDGLGHEVGDQLLIQVGARVETVLGADGVAGRLGGDEFVITLSDSPQRIEARAVALGQHLADALARPYALGAAELVVDASVGISHFPKDARGADELIKLADAAMYEAKATRAGVVVFDGRIADPIAPLALAARLRRAIERDELVLHYQPIFSLAAGQIIGLEALVRWQDPERGLIPPDEFIPVAERTGVIEPLGDWVLHRLCRQAAAWVDMGLTPNFGINISPVQLRRAHFGRRFAEVVAGYGLGVDRFILELTESSFSQQASLLMPALHELREHGLKLAIDDFGAGYSSLWRLRELPVQVIKIDRSFLVGVPDDPKGTAIFAGMLALADACRCDVVAEGIEDAAQVAHLVERGCLLGQGYHLGRPVPPREVELLLRASLAPSRRTALPAAPQRLAS